MAVLETAITFEEMELAGKKFYNTEVIDKNIRSNLLSAISGLASEAFDDEISSFSLGEHTIILLYHTLAEPNNPGNEVPLKMFCIVEKETNEDAIRDCMETSLTQFKNRFSVNDIFSKKMKKFKKFPDRLENIFKDLRLKPEDRFKSIF